VSVLAVAVSGDDGAVLAVKVRVALGESRICPSGPVMIGEMEPSQARVRAASAEMTVPNPNVAPGAQAARIRVLWSTITDTCGATPPVSGSSPVVREGSQIATSPS
jgi:hypothetical protein